MNYWLDLFTGTTWREFRDADGWTSGFSHRMRGTVARIAKGDILLRYLTGVMRWVGHWKSTARPATGRESGRRAILRPASA